MKIIVDSKKFKVKPTSNDIKKISTRIIKDIKTGTNDLLKDVSINDLKNIIENGQTIVLTGFIENFSKNSKIIGQDLVMLDFDNKNGEYTRDLLLNDKFIQDNALFIYDTFSNTNKVNRFRIAFKTSKTLNNYQQVELVYQDLLEMYDGFVDTCIKQTNRLFFGGSNFQIINEKNILDVDWLENVEYEEVIEQIALETLEIPESNNNIHNIRTRNIKELNKTLNTNLTFDTYADFTEYIKKTVDIGKFLGLKYSKSFIDIFHNENNPSASIFKDPISKNWLYKCFSDNNDYVADIFGVVERLAGYANREETTKKMADIFGVTISEDEKYFNVKKSILELESQVDDIIFNYKNPYLSMITEKYIVDMLKILEIIGDYRDLKQNKQVISYLSQKTISNKLKKNESHTKRAINLLVLFGFIDKLSINDVNDELSSKINIYKKNENHRDVNIFKMNIITEKTLRNAEVLANKLYANDFNIFDLNYNYLESVISKDVANKVFPQTHNKNNNKINTLRNVTIKYINTEILKNGYCLENELQSKLKRYCKAYSLANYKLIKLDLSDYFDVKYAKINKDLKTKLNISKNTTTGVFYN